MKYTFPLDSGPAEYIFAPFYDPEHASRLEAVIAGECAQEITRTTLWDCTVFSWKAASETREFILRIGAPFDVITHDVLLICLSAPKDVRFQVALLGADRQVCSRWSKPCEGKGSRQEVALEVASLLRTPWPFSRKGSLKDFQGVALRVHVEAMDAGVLSLSWFGMRNSATITALQGLRPKRPDWSAWLLPEQEWGNIRFERGLVFDETQLPGVREKIGREGWRQHFELLEERALEYLKRIPEADLGDYLPNHDARYIRAREAGRTAYHWEAIVLAFVGLVREDRAMIGHALRYLMCMVHTRNWTESAEHSIPSSTWTVRCFMAEMTSTSVALLYDWLGYALQPGAKNLIRQALWERGMTKAQRDLLIWDYVHQMNQGAVFSRALVLGGLMLEPAWPRLGRYVDDAYETMAQILDRYIKPDGGVHEGVGYLCQTLTACLWTIIAYNRARGTDWKADVARRFSGVGRYVATMSTTQPGKAIPAGDCRTEWFGGDAVPVLADVFPESPMAKILNACLIEGSVHELTGTLAMSGGLIGLVYGPEEVKASTSVVPEFEHLRDSGKVTVTRGNNLTSTRIWISGSAAGQTHSHRDVGQFCLEVNGDPVFIDRGMVEYWFTEAHYLARSWLHNVLTPLAADGNFLCQEVPTGEAQIAVSMDHGRISVPGNNVWSGWMDSYERRFVFHDASSVAIADNFTLKQPGRVAFHLHSPHEFRVVGRQVILKLAAYTISVSFPWAERVECRNTLIDLRHRQVFHICATSPILEADQVVATQINIER